MSCLLSQITRELECVLEDENLYTQYEYVLYCIAYFKLQTLTQAQNIPKLAFTQNFENVPGARPP